MINNKKKIPLRPPRIMIVRSLKQNTKSKDVVKEISQSFDLIGIISSECI